MAWRVTGWRATLTCVRSQGMPELKLGLNDRLSGEGGANDAGPSSAVGSVGGGSPAGRDAGGCVGSEAAAAAQTRLSPSALTARLFRAAQEVHRAG